MIRLNPYFTQKFIWNRFMDSSIIKSQTQDTGLTLNENGSNPEINIKLSRAANFMIHFRAKPTTDGSPPDPIKVASKDSGNNLKDLNITMSNESNNLFLHICQLIIHHPKNSSFSPNAHLYNLFDGTITFLPLKFNIQEYRLQQFQI